MLVRITGNDRAQMEYRNYETEIVLKQGIELVGWSESYGPLVNASQLASNVQMLQSVLNDISKGVIRFVALSEVEKRKRRALYNEKV